VIVVTIAIFALLFPSRQAVRSLTDLGCFWISRLRKGTSSEIVHVLAEMEGYMEALIFLGASRANRVAHAVRLVQFRYKGRWYLYITNVLEPTQLTGAQIVQLYARRWDIKLAFRALKEHLHLRLLWSAKWEVIGVQILASVLLTNLFHAIQQEVPARAEVEGRDSLSQNA
jgi:hypothetical protein